MTRKTKKPKRPNAVWIVEIVHSNGQVVVWEGGVFDSYRRARRCACNIQLMWPDTASRVTRYVSTRKEGNR